jgi:hypothetical protein
LKPPDKEFFVTAKTAPQFILIAIPLQEENPNCARGGRTTFLRQNPTGEVRSVRCSYASADFSF